MKLGPATVSEPATAPPYPPSGLQAGTQGAGCAPAGGLAPRAPEPRQRRAAPWGLPEAREGLPGYGAVSRRGLVPRAERTTGPDEVKYSMWGVLLTAVRGGYDDWVSRGGMSHTCLEGGSDDCVRCGDMRAVRFLNCGNLVPHHMFTSHHMFQLCPICSGTRQGDL